MVAFSRFIKETETKTYRKEISFNATRVDKITCYAFEALGANKKRSEAGSKRFVSKRKMDYRSHALLGGRSKRKRIQRGFNRY